MDGRKRILELVAQNKITPEEASRLIEALKEKKRQSEKARQLVIHAWKDKEENPAMLLKIPIGLVQLGARFIPRRARIGLGIGSNIFDFSAINWNDIFEIAARGEIDDILSIDLLDDDGNPVSIRIYTE